MHSVLFIGVDADGAAERTQTAPPDGVVVSQSVPTMPATNGAGSELESLFAKLLPTATAPQQPLTTSGNSILDLFINGGPTSQPSQAMAQAIPSSISGPGQTSAARSLLDMMFASAAQSTPVATTVANPLPPQPEEIVIVSPKPTSSALPHVLTQEVLSSIMGLAPDSRASSAAPSSVGSRRSAQRYEGDNEFSEGDFTSEGEYSRSATTTRGSTRNIPTLAVPQGPSSESEPEVAVKVNGSRRIPGDVTPRPPAGGIRLPPTSPPQFQQQQQQQRTETPSKVNGNGAASSSAPDSAPRIRPLVPFEANSDLWPYPRAPLDDRSLEMQDDVVELDFSDTRALSDPSIYSTRLREKKDRKEKGRKSRKERDREKEREKAEIEKGWDLPTQSVGQPAYQSSATGPVAEAATSASQPQQQQQAQVTRSPKQAKKAAVNGRVQIAQNGALDDAAAKDAIVHAMSGKNHVQLERNEFVRELLTLIHVRVLALASCTQPLTADRRLISSSWRTCGETTCRGPRNQSIAPNHPRITFNLHVSISHRLHTPHIHISHTLVVVPIPSFTAHYIASWQYLYNSTSEMLLQCHSLCQRTSRRWKAWVALHSSGHTTPISLYFSPSRPVKPFPEGGNWSLWSQQAQTILPRGYSTPQLGASSVRKIGLAGLIL